VTSSPRIYISGVLDTGPKFAMQAWNWILSLRSVGAHQSATIVLHYLPGVAVSSLKTFQQLGVITVPISAFGSGPAAYCNKIQQLRSGAFHCADFVILSDLDIAFLEDPTRLATGNKIRAKIVDLPKPPEPVWRSLLARFGFHSDVEIRPTDFSSNVATLATNFNGGLYVLPQAAIEALQNSWPEWAQRCLDSEDLLKKQLKHSDQLGFALAVLNDRLEWEALESRNNFPTHFAKDSYLTREAESLSALHYHGNVDSHGLPKTVGIQWIDDQINRAADAIRQARRSLFSNEIFWDFRYLHDPGLGSGLGSRDEPLNIKRNIILPFLEMFSEQRVIDLGCGDLEATRNATCEDYLGLDISFSALDVARTKRPDWRFSSVDIADLQTGACDLLLCLDLLIHQDSNDKFQALIANMLRVSNAAIIVSGYEQEPSASGIIFYHQALADAFAQHGKVHRVVRIGGYRDVGVFLVVLKGFRISRSVSP